MYQYPHPGGRLRGVLSFIALCVCLSVCVLYCQFGGDWVVMVTKPDRSYIMRKIRDVLPSAFDGSALQPQRQIDNTDSQS